MKFFQAQSMTLLRAITPLLSCSLPPDADTCARASIAALVNGEAITNTDIEQRIADAADAKKTITRREALTSSSTTRSRSRRQRYGLDLSAADIDSAYANMASRMLRTTNSFQDAENNGIRPQTLGGAHESHMTRGVVRGRFNSTLTPADKDPRADGREGRRRQDRRQLEYAMRPSCRGPRGAAPSAVELWREANCCASASMAATAAEFFARCGRAIRDQVVKTSADLSEPLRELLDKTPIGKLTPPEITKQGIEMVAPCGREHQDRHARQARAEGKSFRAIRSKVEVVLAGNARRNDRNALAWSGQSFGRHLLDDNDETHRVDVGERPGSTDIDRSVAEAARTRSSAVLSARRHRIHESAGEGAQGWRLFCRGGCCGHRRQIRGHPARRSPWTERDRAARQTRRQQRDCGHRIDQTRRGRCRRGPRQRRRHQSDCQERAVSIWLRTSRPHRISPNSRQAARRRCR